MNEFRLMVSKNIENEIKWSGLRKTEIASRIGITKATLSQYLSGRAIPTLETFSKLCQILDCSADDILNIHKK
jgi:DNA-binding Xre family transcriptional regulator